MHKHIFYLVLLLLGFICQNGHAQMLLPPNVDAVVPQAVVLKFRDFYKLPVGPLGLEMTETLRQADKKAVTLVGYMVQQDSPLPGRFMLTPRPVQMSEHADGEADDLPPAMVVVYLDTSQQNWVVPHLRGLVSLTGVLSVGQQDEAAGRTSWVRLHLPAEAARTMNAFELLSFQHNQQHRH